MKRLLFSAALAAALACGKAPDPIEPPDSGPLARVEVGTGTGSFVALKDGDPVNIVKGPQGGHHIWGALRCSGPLNPNGLEVHFRIFKADPRAEIQDNPYRITLQQNGEFAEWYGMIGFLPNGPSEVAGVATVLRMEVKDAEGRTAFDERRVVPQGP
jgi:hypothetical protein